MSQLLQTLVSKNYKMPGLCIAMVRRPGGILQYLFYNGIVYLSAGIKLFGKCRASGFDQLVDHLGFKRHDVKLSQKQLTPAK
jgi:hypothetical protein